MNDQTRDKLCKAIERITEKGGRAEVFRNKEGYRVFEVKRKSVAVIEQTEN